MVACCLNHKVNQHYEFNDHWYWYYHKSLFNFDYLTLQSSNFYPFLYKVDNYDYNVLYLINSQVPHNLHGQTSVFVNTIYQFLYFYVTLTNVFLSDIKTFLKTVATRRKPLVLISKQTTLFSDWIRLRILNSTGHWRMRTVLKGPPLAAYFLRKPRSTPAMLSFAKRIKILDFFLIKSFVSILGWPVEGRTWWFVEGGNVYGMSGDSCRVFSGN